MRASILTFIFIISESSVITGGDGNCGDPPGVKNAFIKNVTNSKFRMTCNEGYVRQAGTSNLFKCINNKWNNNLPLVCMRHPALTNIELTTPIHTPDSPVTPSLSSPTQNTHYVDRNQTKTSTSTTSGKIVFTTTHTTSATAWTSRQTSQRTTTMEETSVTTSITSRITASSTTEKENLITMSSHSTSSLSTTSSGSAASGYQSGETTKSITAGIVIVLIIAGLAATVAVLFCHRRSRLHGVGGHSVEMTTQNPGSDQPLIKTHTIMSSCPPDVIQPPVTPFKDSPESTYTDAPLSA